MPYKLKKKGSQVCVCKENADGSIGKEIACHPSRAKALMQMRALYANEKADLAGGGMPCVADDCARLFIDFKTMLTHLEAVHGEDVEEAREFTAKQRKNAAGKGQAMPGGGFPIQNAQDLKNAIRAYGRAANKAAAKAHIIRRAKALGLTRLLPSGWS